MILSEIFNKQNVDYEIIEQTNDSFRAKARVKHRDIKFTFIREDGNPKAWELGFFEMTDGAETSHLTGKGGEFEVFSLVKKFLLEAIERYSPEEIFFTGEDRQGNFYSKFLKKILIPGYTFKEQINQTSFGKFWKLELIRNENVST